MLINAISEDLHELLQNGRLAAVALLRKSSRVVVVTIDAAIMLVVAV